MVHPGKSSIGRSTVSFGARATSCMRGITVRDARLRGRTVGSPSLRIRKTGIVKRRRQFEREPSPQEVGLDLQFDRRAAEMLALELMMLAKAHGLTVGRVEIMAPKRSARPRRPRADGRSAGRALTTRAPPP